MKFVQYLASFATMALVLSVGAFAKDSHSGNFVLSDAVQVGSTQLAPGNYKVEWNGPPNDVKVDFMKNGKTVATTQGKIHDLQKPSPYTAVTTKPAENNRKQLDEIDFGNRTEALVLGGE
ncbi:MAG: hypothetical protein WB919_08085 [Candidatus Sulfotelmatobacter sp.]